MKGDALLYSSDAGHAHDIYHVPIIEAIIVGLLFRYDHIAGLLTD